MKALWWRISLILKILELVVELLVLQDLLLLVVAAKDEFDPLGSGKAVEKPASLCLRALIVGYPLVLNDKIFLSFLRRVCGEVGFGGLRRCGDEDSTTSSGMPSEIRREVLPLHLQTMSAKEENEEEERVYEEVFDVRFNTRQQNVKKTLGCSWIEFRDGVHVYGTGDQAHSAEELIYNDLRSLYMTMGLSQTSS
ncbi:hypothetical protein Tco_0961142 [Tanacetum coccineum]